jgi:limonene-1,2-epoxide hydrolase
MCGPDQAACGLVVELIRRYRSRMADFATRPVMEGERQEVDRSPMRVVERFLALLSAKDVDGAAGFEVYTHTISANGPSVLTERTDVLLFRRLRIQFWVCGRFDVRDGQVVLWRDYFSLTSYSAATLRGLLGMVISAARAKPPVVSAPAPVTGPAPSLGQRRS